MAEIKLLKKIDNKDWMNNREANNVNHDNQSTDLTLANNKPDNVYHRNACNELYIKMNGSE